jgi:hypothetical protein
MFWVKIMSHKILGVGGGVNKNVTWGSLKTAKKVSRIIWTAPK